MPVDIEVFRKIHDNEDGSVITVGPDADGLDLIEIVAPDSVRLVLRPEMAAALALALLATCNDMKQPEQKEISCGTALLALKEKNV